ncbi:rCG60306, isoform CRA_a [Rattus norvegicus]|uniref:RCG60306, isoform CRA_a n=1 Tax=Rattus norvegicus TaxID=10116 RepID=A6HRX5_RAT|nr:rCG60306, isoform CRA_a [Rattus norvegicus]
MRTVLLLLLAVYLTLSPGAALQCYSCTAQVSNRDCLNVQNCTLDQNSCFTSRVLHCPPHPTPSALCPTSSDQMLLLQGSLNALLSRA